MKVEAALVQRLGLLQNTEDGDADSVGGRNGKPLGVRSEWGTWKRLFLRPYRERTLIGVMIMAFQRKPLSLVDFAVLNTLSFVYSEWSGINALLYYGPILVRSVGLGSREGDDDAVTLMVSGGIGIVQFLSVVPVIIMIDRVGEQVDTWGSWTCLSKPIWHLQEGNHCYVVSYRWYCRKRSARIHVLYKVGAL